MAKKRINLASQSTTRPATDQKASIAKAGEVSARAATDSAILSAGGSAIDIPRTALSKGAMFGEKITPQALQFAVRREPIAKRLVIDIAEDIFDKWFEVHPVGLVDEEPESQKTLNHQVQAKLQALNARTAFIQATKFEREYGWSILVIGYKDQAAQLQDPLVSASDIDHLAVYSPRQVTVPTEQTDENDVRFGLPLTYKIDRGKGKTSIVDWSRVLHVATRIDDHPWAGVSVLEAIWDDMTVYRNIRWAAGQVYWRLAGLMVFTLPKDYTKDEIDSFFNSLGDPNARTFIGLPDDKKLEILTVAGRVLKPGDFADDFKRNISTGSGVPKQKLEGTEAGAITGSEVNQREYFKYVSDQQKLLEAQLVRPLIDALILSNQIPTVDYEVKWNSAFQLDLQTEMRAKLADAKAGQLELYYSLINEVRARRGQKPLTPQEIQEVLSYSASLPKSVGTQGTQTATQ
jgi:phage-related protein (TIGR01555 family)